MPDYKAPQKEMQFILKDLLRVQDTYAKLGFEDIGEDLIDAILDEAAKFHEQVIAPLNQPGDEVGVKWEDTNVTMPPGFVEAYTQFQEAGWASLDQNVEYGGQGLPSSLGMTVSEMTMSSCLSLASVMFLTPGSISAIEAHGSDELKATYLEKLVSGTWSGTMCLTEPHAGTDLSLLKTKAADNGDGSFSVTGTKIFITGGEHDMSQNIIHLVLARLPDAPAGNRGISLFAVPKFLPDANGEAGERNALSCGSVEKKMGIKASPTCVMNFDGAKGWLVGGPNQGLACMFTMMNHARLGVAMQGLSQAERSFQGALEYARDRIQTRSLSGPKAPDKAADPIIVHPDVRRMLLTQKALIEGSRALGTFVSLQMDIAHKSNGEEQQRANNLLALLIPITKSFLTDVGLEATSYGVQIHGGHGFIHEWGMEQLMRDSRILPIYEGTNGIQALDLVRRKTVSTGGQLQQLFASEIDAFLATDTHPELGGMVETLAQFKTEWLELTDYVLAAAGNNPEEIGATSVDYLNYSAYVILAFFWARMAQVAQQKLDAGEGDADFYQAKLFTARFYYDRILPRTETHKAALKTGANNLMGLDAEHFAF